MPLLNFKPKAFSHLPVEMFNTVDLLLFVGYQFRWISWLKGNHECSKKYKFSMVYIHTLAKTKSNIQDNTSFPQSKKICTHKNSWIHSFSISRVSWDIFLNEFHNYYIHVTGKEMGHRDEMISHQIWPVYMVYNLFLYNIISKIIWNNIL